jgi:hypothetical protein
MRHPSGHTALLTLVLSLSLVSLVMARNKISDPAKPRVVATVTTLEPRGLARIRTVDGATYEVLQGTTWRVGDTVECEQNERTRVPWQVLDCRKAS